VFECVLLTTHTSDIRYIVIQTQNTDNATVHMCCMHIQVRLLCTGFVVFVVVVVVVVCVCYMYNTHTSNDIVVHSVYTRTSIASVYRVCVCVVVVVVYVVVVVVVVCVVVLLLYCVVVVWCCVVWFVVCCCLVCEYVLCNI